MLRDRSCRYDTAVSRSHRTAYVILVDMSGSMMDVIDIEGREVSKGEGAVRIAEHILQDIYLGACCNGEVVDCCDVAFISYSGRGVMSHLGSAESPFVAVDRLKDAISSIRVYGVGRFDTPSDVAGQQLDGGVLLSPCGDSPMYESLLWVYELLEGWCSHPDHLDSAAPKLFHITDGFATDASLDEVVDMARNIMSLGTNDGDVLMFNMQLGSLDYGSPLLFPTEQEVADHGNKYFQKLANASSLLPVVYDEMVARVRGESVVSQRCRAIGYNASVVDVLSLVEIGAIESCSMVFED